jgi:peptide methionine sulfoxide reductase MsrB
MLQEHVKENEQEIENLNEKVNERQETWENSWELRFIRGESKGVYDCSEFGNFVITFIEHFPFSNVTIDHL